jgi:hypothetical protein
MLKTIYLCKPLPIESGSLPAVGGAIVSKPSSATNLDLPAAQSPTEVAHACHRRRERDN